MNNFNKICPEGNTMLYGNTNNILNKFYRETCPECYGEGIIPFKTRESAVDYLYHCGISKFKLAMAIMRKWKKSGEITCIKCKGEGRIKN